VSHGGTVALEARFLIRDPTAGASELAEVHFRCALFPDVAQSFFVATIANRAPGHRLRLHVSSASVEPPTPVAPAHRSDTPSPHDGPYRRWQHDPPRTYPFGGRLELPEFVIVAPELTEAELGTSGDVFLTLLRSVTTLTRRGLRTRRRRVGPPLATPMAACAEAFSTRFVVAERPGPSSPSGLVLSAVPCGSVEVPVDESLLRLEPSHIEVSSFRPDPHTEDAVLLRLSNPSSHDDMAVLTFALPVDSVWLVDGTGHRLCPVTTRGGAYEFRIPGRGGVSLRMTLRTSA
jgi:hypothetical protein